MSESKLEIGTDYDLKDLVETIKSQWTRDEIFELIQKLNEELDNFEFTKRVYDLFYSLMLDLVEQVVDAEAQPDSRFFGSS